MTPILKKKSNLIVKPPTVVILGHVDSGKTSLLDFIRKTNIASHESGGITQHIGAYQIEHDNKIINFIDTPGHEAFSAMRARGAQVADIAILVVACDQGVKPQTKEALTAIKNADIPFIIALNKTDLPTAIPQKTKQELVTCQVNLEEFGGQTPAIEISAKTGQGIDELLEMVNLIAEMEELKYDPNQPGQGVVIESHLDERRGPTATVLISNGTIKLDDAIVVGTTYGKIKAMENTQLKNINQAVAQPVVITGFIDVPAIGNQLQVVSSANEAQKLASQNKAAKPIIEKQPANPETKKFNLILKFDVLGTQEAIEACLAAIPQQEISLNILQLGIGNINESDVKLALTTNSQIFSFRVKIDPPAQALLANQKVRIRNFQVIYELIEAIRQSMGQLLSPEIRDEILGRGRVIAFFKQEKNGAIFGVKITQGKFTRGARLRILRDDQLIGQGRIKELQFEKKKVNELEKDKNAGILFEGCPDVAKGDHIEAFQEVSEKKQL